MANLKYGSSGSEVKKLQEALIAAGYNVGSTKADGVFGKNTLAAVKQYQKDNGLAVDGIAGKNTLGSLYSSNTSSTTTTNNTKPTTKPTTTPATKPATTPTTKPTTTPTTPTTKPNNTPATKPATTPTTKPTTTPTTPTTKPNNTPATTPTTKPNNTPSAPPATPPSTPQATPEVKPFTYEDFSYDKQFSYDDFKYDKQFSYGDFSYGDFSYADYAESDVVKQANALLQQQIANKPGAYQSQWESQINDYMNQIQNRDPFSYDFNSDALYQQYKDNYIQQGQMAMMDTMGQAAAMTGGYGNSYAQTVGQQAYNQQLSQLNNIMPELYQMAHNRYTQEGQELQNQYNMLLDRENQDYGRYMDSLNAWQAERDYLANRYDAEREYDYSKWESDRSLAYDQYTSDRSYAYDQWSSGRDLAYDAYVADKNLAYDQWSSGRDLAYDEYVADRNLAYDQWSSDRDLAYDEYQNAVNMAYQKDRDAVADAQWQAKMDAEDARWQAQMDAEDTRWQAEFDEEKRRYEEQKVASAAKGSGDGHQYKDINVGDDAYNSIIKEVERAADVDALKAIVKKYLGLGYNPAQVDALTADKAASFVDQDGGDTGVPDTTTPASYYPFASQAEKDKYEAMQKKNQNQSPVGTIDLDNLYRYRTIR